LREIGSLAVVMLPARLVQSRIASGLRTTVQLRRTPKLLSCIALGLALLVAQTGALLHTTSHTGEPQDQSGLHSQLCEACVSFSTIFSMAGGLGTTPVLPAPVVAFLIAPAILSLVERAVPSAFRSRAPPHQ
jgi:hypothetical protein